MNLNFEMILFYAIVVTGLVSLLDVLFLAPRRKRRHKKAEEIKLPLLIDYARSFFPILVIVFLLRSFLFEPFRIPSGSLEPTLLTGDFILVNKYKYGIRLPVIHKKIVENNLPQRGDIMVFRWPPNPSYDFIKRVIGIPGDKISYVNKELTINGEKMSQNFLEKMKVYNEAGNEWEGQVNRENLMGVPHRILIDTDKFTRDFHDIIVPPGMYFVMGDNRDDSADSRYFGFVPEENILGKAVMVLLSWDGINKRLRFNRTGEIIH